MFRNYNLSFIGPKLNSLPPDESGRGHKPLLYYVETLMPLLVLLLLLIFFGDDRIYQDEIPPIGAQIIKPTVFSNDSDAEEPKAIYSAEQEEDAATQHKVILISELSVPGETASENIIPKAGPDAELLGLSPQTRMALDKIQKTPSLAGLPNGPKDSFSLIREKPEPQIFNQKIPEDDTYATEQAREKAPRMEIEVKKPSANISKLLGEAYDALGADQDESAIALYNQVLLEAPKNKTALFGLGVAYQKSKQSEQARGAYSKLLAEDPKNLKALNNYLMVVGEEAPSEALAEFQKIAKKNGRIAAVPAAESMIELKTGNFQDAAGFMVQALQIEPDNIQYKYNLAVILDKMGDRTQAVMFYREVLDQAKNGNLLSSSTEKIRERLIYLSSAS